MSEQRLGDTFALARKTRKMIQPVAAAQAGVSIGTWSRMERGTPPGDDYLAIMAEVVGVTPEQLTELGHDDAARLLSARQSHAEPSASQGGHDANGGADGAYKILYDAWMGLLPLGYEVTLRQTDNGTLVLEASPRE